MSLNSPPNQFLPLEPAPVAVQLVNVAGEVHDDAVALSKDGKLTVAVNDGAGKWQSIHSFDTGVVNAQGFAVGLFNQDAILDVVVQGSDSLVLMVGDGQGNFTAAETILPGAPGSFSSGAGRVGLATGAFAEDFKQDLVVLQPGANTVLVFHTNQDGKLSTATVSKYSTGGIDPIDVEVGDFVGDGFKDLAIGHRDGSVTFLAGDKSGGFSLVTDATTHGLGSIVDLDAADFDADGDLDLVVASTDRVTILSQDDDVLTTSPIANGDFSSGLSGWTGTADANALGGALQLREGTGLLSSVSQTFVVPTGAQTISFDLVSLGLEAPNGGIPDAFEASLLDANGNSLVATFRSDATSFFNANPGGQVAWGSGVTYNAATGRVTLDISGLAAGTSATLYFDLVGNLPGAGSTVTIDRVQITPDAVRTNHFTPLAPLAGGFTHVTAVAAGDVDGNGKLDLVVADSGAGNLVVYDRTPTGSYQRSEQTLAPIGTQAVALAIGNLTAGDAAADVAVALADTNRLANPLGNGYDLVAPTASLASPTANGSSSTPVQQIVLQFSEAMFAVPGAAHSILNPGAYSVVGAGPNGIFGDADDRTATVSGIVYDAATHRATLTLNGGTNPLGAGKYRVSLVNSASAFVLQDLAGNPVQNGQGFQAAFTVLPPADHTAPTATLTFTPDHLWPPNHKMVTVTAQLAVTDDTDASPRVELVSITSNEPDTGESDIQGAAYGTDDRTFQLRAERLGTGDGRTYTITYRVTDATGNSRLVSGVVRVAHDQGEGGDDSEDCDPIQPLEQAKFVVVDVNEDRVYGYGDTGAAKGEAALTSANNNARGVASSADGETRWVIDSNKNVYVYDRLGVLKGSWTASGLNKPEDITVVGNDVFIVDAGAKKVYRYNGAATRLSGSQSATSSFSLDSQNKKATGIVSDGTRIWVTDEGRKSVFVYNMTGTKLGEWNLASANADPRGITISPTGGSDVWIVDGDDAKVYRYADGRTRLSGTGSVASSFNLADDNDHPEGIADPPTNEVVIGQTFGGTAAADETPDDWIFQGTAGQRIFVQGLSGDVYFKIYGAEGDWQFFSRAPAEEAYELPETGAYRLEVFTWSGADEPYSLQLLSATRHHASVELGDHVVGSIAAPGDDWVYTIDAAAGEEIWFRPGANTPGGLEWALSDESGVLYSTQTFETTQAFYAATSGTYTLVVKGPFGETGAFDFTVGGPEAAPLQRALIYSGQFDSQFSVPDRYSFNVAAGETLVFANASTQDGADWTLTDAAGVEVFSSALGTRPWTFATGGTYTLTVRRGTPEGFVGYGFFVVSAPSQTVVAGQPLFGSFEDGAFGEVHRLTVSANSRLNFHWDYEESGAFLTLFRSDGSSVVLDRSRTDASTPPLVGGTYWLAVGVLDGGYAPNYSFSFTETLDNGEPPQPIEFGATVDVALDGTHPQYVYSFDGEAGQNLVFDSQSLSFSARWALQGPNGEALFNDDFVDQGPIELPAAGAYRLTVYSLSGQTTNVRFRITEVLAPTVTPVAFGQNVTSAISTPQEVDVYTFVGTAGETLVFQGSTVGTQLGFNLASPGGQTLFQDVKSPRELVLPESGVYRLTIKPLSTYPDPNVLGDYTFRLLHRAPTEPILLNTLIVDDNLDAAVHSYSFHLEAGQKILFDLSGLDGAGYALSNPWGTGIAVSNAPQVITATGEYTLQITPGAVLGEFRFQVQEVRSPQMGALDSRGTEFWTGFGSNGALLGVDAIPYIFIASETATSGSVQIPRIGFARAFTVEAGGVAKIQLPNSAHPWTDYSDLGILVTALDEVSVYGVSQFPASSGGFTALPTDALGTDYMVTAYRNNGGLEIQTEFVIVATEDDTHVTITPPPSAAGEPDLEPETIVLQRGQLYYRPGIFGRNDVTGTSISSDKKIAVLGGNGGTSLANAPAADFVFEQMTPVATWGLHFFATPFVGQSGTELYRVLAAQDGTEVRLNGALVATLDRGTFWESLVAGPVEIETSAPALASQFSLGAGYGVGSTGDPGMVLLPPAEQFLSSYTFATPTVGFPNNHANLVVRGEGVGTITLDGVLIPAESFTEINGSGWFGASVAVSVGAHHLAGAVPFGAVIYGFNDYDSYIYAGGLALAPLAQTTNLSLTPSAASLQPGSEHVLTAIATDGQGNALQGVRVDFTVTGANPRSTPAFAFTDADGKAVFRYVGTNPGVDVITASIGTQTATAQVEWVAAPASVEVTSPLDGDHLPVGKVLVSGQATAGSALGRIVIVTIDGKPVDALDQAGGFFALVDLALGSQSFTVEATDSAGGTASLVLHLVGETPSSGGLDFSQGSDVTSQGAVSYAGTTYNRRTHTLLATMQLTNLSADPLDGPVVARVDRVGPGNAVLSTSEGADPSGKPYVVFDTELPVGGLAAGATSAAIPLAFAAAAQERFEVDVSLFMRGNDPPAFQSTPIVEAVVGRAYSYAPMVHDPNGQRLQYRLDLAPEGMTVNAATGLLSWTPTADQVGSHEVELVVSDGRGGVARQKFRATVSTEVENRPPLFQSAPPTSIPVGASFDYTPVVVDADHDALAYTLLSAPPGAVFNASTGRIQLASPASGNYGFSLKVADGRGGAAVQSFVLTVGSGAVLGSPQIEGVPPQSAVEGQLYIYQIEAADPQGDPLSYTLVQAPAGAAFDPAYPGRIVWTPTAAQGGPQTFEIKVDDALGGFSSQTFTVDVLTSATNRPPQFVSRPGLIATQGELYAYNLSATDPEGLAVSYEVLVKPSSMTLVDGNRLVFTPGGADLGRQRILVKAVDPLGGAAYQQFYLDVRGTNLAPEFTSSSTETATAGAVFHYDAQVSDVDAVTFALVDGPSGATIDPRSGNLVWNTSAADVGSHSIVIRATDERGLVADQTLQLTLVADHTAPNVYVMLSQNLANPGDDVTISVRALDDVAVTGLVFKVNGQVVQLVNGQYVHHATQGGFVDFEATAVDAQGNTSTDSARLRVFDPTDTAPPVITLDSPQPDSVVTYLTNIVGSISDANMDSYKLELSLAGMNQWRTIAEGTGQVSHGLLGVFDPTMLENDYYDIRISAIDVNGRGSSLQFSLSVEGNAKLGEFSLSYTDLTIPVAGIPITITRTYSTLHADQQGDFGYGWTLSIADAHIRETRPVSEGERQFGILGATPFTKGTRIYLTAPSGERIGFTFDPVQDIYTQFGLMWRPRFVADPGVFETLEVPYAALQLNESNQTFHYYLLGLPFNPDSYTLTTKDGVRYTYGQFDGLRSVEDRNGNTLTYTHDGIFASSGQSIQFIRDSQDRITQIIDPAGNALTYTYDAAGDLVKFEDQVGTKTSMFYDAPRAHYLSEVTNPGCGCRFDTYIKTEYDDAGRIVARYDAAGNPARTEYDLGTHEEKVYDRNGNATTIIYDDRGNVTSFSNPVGDSASYLYDANDNLIQSTNGRGFVSHFEYDSRGNVTRLTDNVGRVFEYAFDQFSHLLWMRDALGRVSGFTYDDRGNAVSLYDTAGQTMNFVYNALGQMVEYTDFRGARTLLTYGDTGQVEKVVDALGNVQTTRFNQWGLPIEAVDADGRTVRIEYDAAGKPLRILEANGRTTTLTWDDNRLTSTTDALGRITSMEYDDRGHLMAKTDPLGNVTRFTYDANGQILTQTDPLGQVLSKVYDAAGRLIEETLSAPGASAPFSAFASFAFAASSSVESPTSITTSYEYDEVGNVVAQTDGNGNTTRFVYDGLNRVVDQIDALGGTQHWTFDLGGNISSWTDENGKTFQYRYDDLNRLIRTIDPLAGVQSRTYDANGNLTSFTDPNGGVNSFVYDALNRLVSQTDALGGLTRWGYDGAGNTTSVVDALGRTTSYDYDANSQLISVVDALGGTTSFGHDAAGNVVSYTDALGRSTTYDYDAADRMVERTDALGGVDSFDYDAIGRLTSQTDALGRTTSYAYDLQGNLVSTTDALGFSDHAAYDAVGNLVSYTDALGRTTSWAYDALNRLVSTVDAAGNSDLSEYDAVGNLLSYTDALGRVSSATYDALNRLTSTTDALGGVDRYAYDGNGNVLSYTDVLGRVSAFSYDALNRLTTSTDPAGSQTTLGYDAVGNLTRTTDPLGFATQFVYDALDRNTQVIDARGGVTSTEYDAVGNVTKATDPLGRSSTYVYDALDRLTRSTDAAGASTAQEYDAVGNLLALVDPLGNRTEYRYDDLDRVVERIDPLDHSSRFAYDAVGNLTESIDRNGRTTEYSYDVLDRLVEETWLTAGGDEANRLEYTYDAVGNMLSAADAFSRYSFTYDALDRLTTEDNAGSPFSPHVVLTRSYDAYGNLVRTEDDAGVSVAKSYDARNQLSSITWEGLPGGVAASQAFHYDERGYLEGVERFSDAGRTQLVGSTLFDLDELGRISELTHRDPVGEVLAKYDYTWDAASQLTSWTHHGETTYYAFDATGQLTGADNSASPDEGYVYDANGNRTGGGEVVGPNNQLLSDGTFDYVYDAEGNLSTKTERASGEVTTYQYDHRNRLTHIETTSAGGIILKELSFTYDVFDRRIAETVDADGAGPSAAHTTRFVYDGENVWADYDASGQAVARYLFGDGADDLIARWTPPAGTAWYLVDHLGTVHDIVNSAGFLVDHISYDSFGRVLSETNPLAGDRYKFTGREFVSAAGLYYYRARFYDAGNGRFLSQDPLGFAAGDVNLYRYVGNRPTVFTDPSGRMEFLERVGVGMMSSFIMGGAFGAVCGGLHAALDDDPNTTFASGAESGLVQGYFSGGIFGVFLFGAVALGGAAPLLAAGSAATTASGALAAGIPGGMLASASFGVVSSATGIYQNYRDLYDSATGEHVGHTAYAKGTCAAMGLATSAVAVFSIGYAASKSGSSPNPSGSAAGASGPRSPVSGGPFRVCFPAQTPISTPQGLKPIEDIREGDLVFAWDFRAEKVSERRVLATFTNFTKALTQITLDDGVKIEPTSGHPFWVSGAGWTTAEDLRVGMCLIDIEGVHRRICEVAVREVATAVYNFEVEELHNYFAGYTPVLVHNENIPTDFNKATTEAINWLKSQGVDTSKPVEPFLAKFGPHKGMPIGVRFAGGGYYRIEFDDRSGAHINVGVKKLVGPHFQFEGRQSTVNTMIRRLFRC